MSSKSIELEQCLSPKDAKWYSKSPRKYHQGIYLGRNLGIIETIDPVPDFLKGVVAFWPQSLPKNTSLIGEKKD